MLYHGDCLEVLRTLPDNSIDLTVTSPPYDNLRSYNNSLNDWEKEKWEAIIFELYRITKIGGVVVWIVADATINGSETGTSFRQALHAIDCGFRLHDTMIWNKNGFSAVGALASRYAPVWEYMFIWSKGAPKTFNPIKDRPNKHAGSKMHGTIRVDNDKIRNVSGKKTIADFGQRFNIWEIYPQRQKGKGVHPAPFPEALVKDHVLSWSNASDLILDPFMGSGTTGAVAVKFDRFFIGIERESTYFEIAKTRIEAVKE